MIAALVGSDGKSTVLAAGGGEREVRWFLKRHGLRAERRGFKAVAGARGVTLYTMTGDEHLLARGLGLSRLTWGRLTHYMLGGGTLTWLMRGSSEAEIHAEDGTRPPSAWSSSTQKRPREARVTAGPAR